MRHLLASARHVDSLITTQNLERTLIVDTTIGELNVKVWPLSAISSYL
jgi:hypothetical protein